MIFLLNKFITMNNLPFVLIFFTIIFHFLIIKIIYFRKINDVSFIDAKKDFISFQKYLDRYYLNNIWFTSFMVFIYIILNFGILLIFRLLFIGYENNISYLDSNDFTFTILLQILLIISSIILFVVFYRSFLDIIFLPECFKLHYFLNQYNFYIKFKHFYLLSTLRTYLYDSHAVFKYLTEKKVEEDYEFYRSYYFLQNTDNWEKLNYWRNVVQKSIILIHITKFFSYVALNYQAVLIRLFKIPQIVFVLIFCIELFNKTLYYTYYLWPLILLLHMLGQYYTFLYCKNSMNDSKISDYFYKNSISYKMIRQNLYYEHDIIDPKSYKTKETQMLYNTGFNISSFMNYIENKFRHNTLAEGMGSKGMRLSLNMEFLLIIFFFIICKYSSTLSIILHVVLSIIFVIYIFFLKDNINLEIINKIYLRLFYFISIIQMILIYILIIQSKLFFLDNDILWDFGFTIKKNLILQDKIMFFSEYFKYICKENMSQEEYIYAKNIIATLDIKTIVFETDSMKDIKEKAKILLEAYLLVEEQKYFIIKDELMQEHIAYCEQLSTLPQKIKSYLYKLFSK